MQTKNYILILLLALFLLPVILFGQTGTAGGIMYTYDAAGNRVHRSPATSSERKASPGTIEKKETAVVSKNNLQASFTPNPTFTGNFTVVVSSSDFSPADKNTNENKAVGELTEPQIFIYNLLGELIHQESTQYNTQANIDLSKYSKGIYIVKVLVLSEVEGQSREETLMYRMAYQ